MCEMLVTSIPRPTTSVATRQPDFSLAERGHHAVAGRLLQVAVDAGHVLELLVSRRWTLSVPRLVRQKTIACRGCSRSNSRSSRSNLRSGSTVK